MLELLIVVVRAVTMVLRGHPELVLENRLFADLNARSVKFLLCTRHALLRHQKIREERPASLSFAKTASALTVEKSAKALTRGLNTLGSCGVRRQLAPSALSIGGNERRVMR